MIAIGFGWVTAEAVLSTEKGNYRRHLGLPAHYLIFSSSSKSPISLGQRPLPTFHRVLLGLPPSTSVRAPGAGDQASPTVSHSLTSVAGPSCRNVPLAL